MPPKPEEPGPFARLFEFVRGLGSQSSSSVRRSQGVAEATNTGPAALSPHDTSTLSNLLPRASNIATLVVQGAASQTSMLEFLNGLGSRSSPSVGRSQTMAETTDTGPAVLSPHDTSTLSIPLPLTLASSPTTLIVPGSASQTSMQPSADEQQQIESLRPTASAPCLAAPQIDPDPTPQSLIHPTPAVAAGGSLEATASHDHHDRLPPPHPPQVPPLNSPPAVSVLERAHNFQMRDLVVSVVHAEPNPLEIRT